MGGGPFDGQVFLVTGASSGIGLAIARALVQRDARVALMARNREKLEALQAEWGGEANVLVTAGDVTLPEDCAHAVVNTQAAFGRLDGLIHSAGVSMRGTVAETRPEVFRQLMDTNFFSCLSLIQPALPAIKRARGHVVVISSLVGKLSPPGRSGYAASKHAVQALLDALRVEVAADGVHVLAVCPGFVHTEISRNALAADGSRWGKLDVETAQGLEPAVVALDVVNALIKRTREITPAGPVERGGLLLARFAPGLLDRVLERRLARQKLLIATAATEE